MDKTVDCSLSLFLFCVDCSLSLFLFWGEYMNVEVREKNGKWGVWTDEIRYNSYDTETEAQDKATRIRRAAALMDKLQETVEKETAEWDEADKAEFSAWYGTGTTKALNL